MAYWGEYNEKQFVKNLIIPKGKEGGLSPS